MWTSMLLAIATVTAYGGSAPSVPSPADSTHTCCVEDALRLVPPRQIVTLTCWDGSRAKGEILGFDASQGVIRLLPDGAPRPGHSDAWFTPADPRFALRTLPAADVTRLEWRGRGGSGTAGAILGLLLGALVGGLVGDATSPETTGFLDFTRLEHTVAGTAIGGFLGLVVGYVASSGPHPTHTIDCWDGSSVSVEPSRSRR